MRKRAIRQAFEDFDPDVQRRVLETVETRQRQNKHRRRAWKEYDLPQLIEQLRSNEESRRRFLPTEKSTEWAIGWKSIRVYADAEGDAMDLHHTFPGAEGGLEVTFGPDAIAWCMMHDVIHQAPEDPCHCGFYAYLWRTAAVARYLRDEGPQRGYMLARAGYAGEIVEHTVGFRAERQVITDIFVNDVCAACARAGDDTFAELLSADPDRREDTDYGGRRLILRPTCPEHLEGRNRVYYSLDRTAELLGVNVHWWNADLDIQQLSSTTEI